MGRLVLDLFKPLGLLANYLGIVQLPYLFKRETAIHGFLDRILPYFTSIFILFASCNIAALTIYAYIKADKRNVQFATICINNGLNLVMGPVIVIRNFRRASIMLDEYLHSHEVIECLLEPRRRKLNLFVKIGFSIGVLISTLKMALWMYHLELVIKQYDLNITVWYSSYLLPLMLVIFGIGMFLIGIAECFSQFTYIVMQKYISNSFEELVVQLKAIDTRPMGSKTISFKIKTVREQHQYLCDLGERLNVLYSPVLLLFYIVNSITGVAGTFFLTDHLSKDETTSWGSVGCFLVLSIVPFSYLVVISSSASSTSSIAEEVLCNMVSSLVSYPREAKREVKLLALRMKCKKVLFTASGFFEVDLGILVTIVGAMMSYIILMMQSRG